MDEELNYHPLADIFPLIDEAESDMLAEDIAANGLLEPIVLYNGLILDGRNRYRACLKVGIRPETVNYEGIDPAAYVISLNLRRRHLNESQRAMVAAKVETIHQGRPKKDANLHVLRSDVAKMLNVSPRSVASAHSVMIRANDRIIKAVEQGELSVSSAADVSTLSHARQSVLAELGAEAIIKEANRIRRERKLTAKSAKQAAKSQIPNDLPLISDRYQIICSDIRLVDIPENTVDCIITDPPYPSEYLDCYQWLSDAAAHWLKPGGTLAVMCGQTHLPSVLEKLCSNQVLSYRWTFAYLTPGGQSAQIFDRKINTFWKPIIILQKAQCIDWMGDVVKSDVNDNDKRFHEWGQSESGIADLMDRLTYPGQVICDPFLGGGTTAVVALQMNRLFIGCDIDESNVKISASRIIHSLKVA